MIVFQLSAIMHKTGTAQDAERHNLRKNKARAIDGIQDVTPEMLGPTCLIACPSTLVDNVSRSYSECGVIDADCVIRLIVDARAGNGENGP